ncbi:MAG: LEA type 2 family protein [Opitutae bacterium]|nr:LEA type 2 family protein [Opitutae bacterium]
MKALLTRFLVIALFLCGLCGCSNEVKQLSRIAVEIIEATPVPDAARGTKAVLTFRYTNENNIPLAVAGTAHKIYLNNELAAKIVSEEPIGMPPMKSVTQKVTVKFEKPEAIQKLLDTATQQTTAYRIDTKLTVLHGEDRDEITSKNQGSIDLRALAGAK